MFRAAHHRPSVSFGLGQNKRCGNTHNGSCSYRAEAYAACVASGRPVIARGAGRRPTRPGAVRQPRLGVIGRTGTRTRRGIAGRGISPTVHRHVYMLARAASWTVMHAESAVRSRSRTVLRVPRMGQGARRRPFATRCASSRTWTGRLARGGWGTVNDRLDESSGPLRGEGWPPPRKAYATGALTVSLERDVP